MIWLTSDLHLFHNQEFIYKPRGFSSVEEMNEVIEQNWNGLVNDDDEVYILGDLRVGGKKVSNNACMEIVKRLKGKNTSSLATMILTLESSSIGKKRALLTFSMLS